MPIFASAPAYEHGGTEALGVLVANLGTPDSPTPPAVRRYLAEFLSDPRVVETPRWLWWPILHGFILRFRPARSARNYAKIWTPEGSPLFSHSRAIAAGLKSRVDAQLGGDGSTGSAVWRRCSRIRLMTPCAAVGLAASGLFGRQSVKPAE